MCIRDRARRHRSRGRTQHDRRRRPVRGARQQRRHQPPGAADGREGRGFRPHHGPQRARGVLRGAGGGTPPRRDETAGLDHQHLVADGSCRRGAPHRLLRVEACDGGLHQGDGHRAGAPQHPRQQPRPHLPGDADDAAVLREQGVPRRGLGQDQARPPRPAGGADRRDRVSRVRCVVANDRLRAGARRRLDRGVSASMEQNAQDIAVDFARRWEHAWNAQGAAGAAELYTDDSVLVGAAVGIGRPEIARLLDMLFKQGWRRISIKVVNARTVAGVVLVASEFSATGSGPAANKTLNGKSSHVLTQVGGTWLSAMHTAA